MSLEIPLASSSPPTDKDQDSVIAKQQKLIYDWYEKHHGDEDVVDIYSPEWHKRISKWLAEVKEKKAFEEDRFHNLDDFDIRLFFSAHPVAAFSLWRIIQSFKDIHNAVCEPSTKACKAISPLRDSVTPFVYLKSEIVRSHWESELKSLSQLLATQIQDRNENVTLGAEDLKSRMFSILHGVEKLEDLAYSLRDDLASDLLDEELVDKICGCVQEAVDLHCLQIADTLKIDDKGDNEEQKQGGAKEKEDEENYDATQDSGESTQTTPAKKARSAIASASAHKLRSRPSSSPISDEGESVRKKRKLE